jgi:hypothetical protein
MSERSKISSTSFKKGNIPWNKKPRIEKECANCGINFKVFPNEADGRKCCSKKCTDSLKRKDYSEDTKATISYKLALEGKTIREISEITGYPPGSVASYLNKMNYRRYAEGGNSYSSIRKKLLNRDDYHSCVCCDFSRGVELAHIIPASEGGQLTYENTLPLCPNHHYLFDNNKLSEEEKSKLSLAIEVRSARKK